ncbi:MAG: hypothetical protein E6H07_05550 [Bacteroidetes bacterium]|nr:MAG: hypothetical protein E6H07_05550 [Bacteroidota bacterium]
MKKIFTLLAAVTIVAAAQAQNGQGNNSGKRQNDQQGNNQNGQRDKQNGYGNDNDIKNHPYDNDDRYDNNSNFEGNKGQRIAQINREYEYKIQKVRSSRFMSRSEKKRQIRFLEEQRQQEIRRINYSSNRSRNNDRYDRNDNNDRSNRRY